MSKLESTEEDLPEPIVVNVSEKGQATIPMDLRKKHGIETPGKVEFYENEDGEIVVQAIPSIRNFRGAGKKPKDKRPGTDALRESRERDKEREESLKERGDGN